MPPQDISAHWECQWGAFQEQNATSTEVLQLGLSVVVCTYRRPDCVERFLISIAAQNRTPDELIIVDASPDDLTEKVTRKFAESALPFRLCYVRVTGSLAGLTRQRNYGIRLANRDLTAFFDDDVVLEPDCLLEMEKVHRERGSKVSGVGAYVQNQFHQPTLLWRLRRQIGIVHSLRPGCYEHSGMSIPWSFQGPTDDVLEADWLTGCAAMWRTEIVRKIGFYESFPGYANGEDLDFSLRAKQEGQILMAGKARLNHFHDPKGRPDMYRTGYMEIWNMYQIHRRCIAGRTWRDVAWFVYAWTIDSLLLVRHLIHRDRTFKTARQLSGRLRASYDIVVKGT